MASASGESAGLGQATMEARSAKLEQVVALWVRQGWRLESRLDASATIAKGGGLRHPFDFALITLTLGRLGRVNRRLIEVDDTGRVVQRKLSKQDPAGSH